MPRESGTVKFFNTQKGYGFILGSGAGGQGQIEYFVHFSAIKSEGFKSLAAGEAVEFDLENNPMTGKQCAVNVTGPGGSAVQGSPQEMKGPGKGGKGGQGFPGGQYQEGGKQFGGKGGKKGGKGGGKGQGGKGKHGGSYSGSYSGGGFNDGFSGAGYGGGGGFGGDFGNGCYTGFMPMGSMGSMPFNMPYPYPGGMQFPGGMMG